MKKNLLILVSCLVASLTLVSCGTDDDSPATSSTPTASSITWPSVSTKADAVKALGQIA